MRGFGRIQLAGEEGGEEGGVSRLELFLDLIFVFAFLNVTGVTAEQLNPAGVPRGLLLLMLLWGCWAPCAWLGTMFRLDRGVMPLVMFGLSATLFVMALTVREAFVDRPGGLSGPVVFAFGYLIARSVPLLVSTVVRRADPVARRQMARAWPPAGVGAVALLAAAIVPTYIDDRMTQEWTRFGLVACVIVVEYGGVLLIGTGNWRISSIAYWAERHALIILIGFGEAIISIGLSQGVAVAQPLTVPVLAGVLLGVALAGALWWTYFDVARFAAEQALSRESGARRALLGRDAYSFLHLPMMAGLILVALGLKYTLGELRVPEEKSSPLPLLVLYGGVVLYLLGLILFEVRTLRLLGRSPILGVVLVTTLIPVALRVPVLAQLTLLAAAVGAMALADLTVFRQRHRKLHEEIGPIHEEVGVTPKELFFDLVFVYAFLQLAALMSDDPTGRGVLRGLLVLTVLWFAWCVYSWLAATVRVETPVVRLVMVLVVAVTAMITLVSPQAFNDALGGLSGPLVFVACYAAIRLLHLGSFWLAAREDPALRVSVVRSTGPTLVALALLLAAALFPHPVGDIRLLSAAQVWLWIVAIVVDLGGNALTGLRHWRIWSGEHWADRYGLIIIIGLGEAVISTGMAALYTAISTRIIIASVLGTTLLATLWWVYFGVDSDEGERILEASDPGRRRTLARDAYTYLHLPMVAGIVLVSLGLRKTMAALGTGGLLDFGPSLYPVAHAALYGGVILYLLGEQGFRWRLAGAVRPGRVVQTLVVAALLPATAGLPPLPALVVLTAVCVAFMTAEIAGRSRATATGTRRRPAALPG